jgi:prepilin signal peptidase PulO-like enzyme (type II secretory pathway)
MAADLATTTPADLGFFAAAVESQPVLTLTTTGVVVGATFGVITGLLWGALFNRKEMALDAVKSAGVMGAMLGIAGFTEAQNLKSWLASST